ncbi:DUF3427 domain-containing protein, partial [Corynebacterium sp. LK2510]|uniref:DUF3427 domain-containing protein n=1 Tax=Corynebacterium sp. LK2510 TaxID=3110472 RepID=UPI0034CF124B
SRVGGVFRINDELWDTYHSYAGDHVQPEISFRAHMDDAIETGLLLNRKHYRGSDQLVFGKMYTRKDVSRLLNWTKNLESTIYGYRVDRDSKTCPIFVTYHKDANVSESIRYEDSLLDPSTMRWFSRHGRTLRSAELQPILHGEVILHIFVKREDADGVAFHYLGEAVATDAQNATMPSESGSALDVVVTNLKLRRPIPSDMFESITAPKIAAVR